MRGITLFRLSRWCRCIPKLERHSPSQRRLEAPPTHGSIHPTFALSLHRREWTLRGFHPQPRVHASKTAALIQDALLAMLCYLVKKFCPTPLPLNTTWREERNYTPAPAGERHFRLRHIPSVWFHPFTPARQDYRVEPGTAFLCFPNFGFSFLKVGWHYSWESILKKTFLKAVPVRTRSFFIYGQLKLIRSLLPSHKMRNPGLLLGRLSRARDMEEHFILIPEPPDCSPSGANAAFSIMHGQGKYSNKVLAKDLPLTHLCSKLPEVSRLSRDKHWVCQVSSLPLSCCLVSPLSQPTPFQIFLCSNTHVFSFSLSTIRVFKRNCSPAPKWNWNHDYCQ